MAEDCGKKVGGVSFWAAYYPTPYDLSNDVANWAQKSLWLSSRAKMTMRIKSDGRRSLYVADLKMENVLLNGFDNENLGGLLSIIARVADCGFTRCWFRIIRLTTWFSNSARQPGDNFHSEYHRTTEPTPFPLLIGAVSLICSLSKITLGSTSAQSLLRLHCHCSGDSLSTYSSIPN